MSEFNIERLRSAIDWAEREAAKETSRTDASSGGLWDQQAWMRGLPSKRVRKIKSVRYGGMYGDTIDSELQGELRQVKCGTSYCVAGHVCADEGDAFLAYDWEVDGDGRVHADLVVPRGSDEAMDVQSRARELLGITWQEAHELFAGYNTITDVRRIAEKIAAAHGEEL